MKRRNRVHGIEGWRRVVLWPLVALLRVWGRTLRIEITETDRRFLESRSRPVIFVLWHNRLFPVPEAFRRFSPARPIHALISASKDGAWLSAFFELAGLATVRGSSSNHGRAAMHALTECLRAGSDVGLTPDGPRGPAYRLKGGVVVLSRKTGVPCVLVGINFDRSWRIRSWDRFHLPLPWSTVRLRLETMSAEQLRDAEDPIAAIEGALNRLNPDRWMQDGPEKNAPARAG